MVFDIDQPRDLVRALKVLAQQVEQPGLVAVQRALGYAKMGLAFLLEPRAQRGQIARPHIVRPKVHGPAGKHVEVHPHLGRDQGTQHAGVLAHAPRHGHDRIRVIGIGDVKADHGALGRHLVAQEECILIGIDADDAVPSCIQVAGMHRCARDLDQAGHVLDALHVTRQPHRAFRIAREQVAQARQHRGGENRNLCHDASTHVSFAPPPCEELTTSDPLRSATRDRPPGSTHVSRPVTAKGRRSTCRASTPAGHSVGETDRLMTGWLM